MSGLLTVGYFLISLIFSLLLFLLWARFALRFFRISSLHPVSQVINQLTTPLIEPIGRLVYSKMGPLKQYDWLSLILIVAIEFLKFISLSLLLYNAIMPLGYLLLFVLGDLIVQPCNLLFYLILIRVIVSWVNPTVHHAAIDILVTITEPLLRLGRRIIPNISGFDFSPLVIMVILKVITLFISASMPLKLI